MSLRAEGEAIYTKLAVFSVARFGAWVVCIYRLWAMQSLSVINCSDLRPFLFSKKIASSGIICSACKFIEQERKVHFVVLRNLSDAVGFYRFATDCAKGDLIDEGDRQYQPEVTR